ncbi:hypothetical protein PSA5_18140 [Pseudomonas syringae pv. actinidiae]|nr:hypothetical protein PSA5_18140 [Pseudomonas syringae pv. actinidiae]
MVLGIEQAFRWRQLVDMDLRVKLPSVRRSPGAQFSLGLGQGDVQRDFARCCTCLQKMQCNGCLAGSGFSLKEENMTA